MKRYVTLSALLALLLTALATAHADLNAYLSRPEPAYRWEQRGEQKVEGGVIYDVYLISQTWQSMAMGNANRPQGFPKPDRPAAGAGSPARVIAPRPTIAIMSSVPTNAPTRARSSPTRRFIAGSSKDSLSGWKA